MVGGGATFDSQRSARRRAWSQALLGQAEAGADCVEGPGRLAGVCPCRTSTITAALKACSINAVRLSCRAQPVFFEGGEPAAPVPEDSKRAQLRAVTGRTHRAFTSSCARSPCRRRECGAWPGPRRSRDPGAGAARKPRVARDRNGPRRGGCPQGGRRAPWHLNELDRPSAGESAGAELDVPGGPTAARQTLVFHAGLEQPDHVPPTRSPPCRPWTQTGAGALVEVALRSDRPGAHSSLAP